MDSSDEDDNVVNTIRLQKNLISESQSLHNTKAVDTFGHLPISSKPGEQAYTSADRDNSPDSAAEAEKSYSDALAANIDYDNVLSKLQCNLEDLISDCKLRIKELSKVRQTGKTFSQDNRNMTGRSNGMYIFGAPYFKDRNFFPCPANIDTKKKEENKELRWISLPPVRWWTPNHTKQLVASVKQSALEACKQEAHNHRRALIRQKNALIASNDMEQANVLDLEIDTFNINKYAQSKLSERIANTDHDWLRISASVLDGRHTPDECRGFWYNYLHPKYQKGSWAEDETEKLKEIAEEHDCQDWDTIAEKIGTNRSGYQCFAQYQNEVGSQVRQKWSTEEDTQLKNMIAKYRVGDYIPWSQVSLHMPCRSQTQVYNRWTYTLNPDIKKGRFTTQEDVIILCGVRKWGQDFQKIARFLPKRTVPQIRMRYQNNTAKAPSAPFTLEDDNLMLDLVKEHGHDWKRISEHFPGKNRIKLRHRYETVNRWMRQNPGKPLEQIGSRRGGRPNIDVAYHSYWIYAEKLLSGEKPHKGNHASTSLLTIKPNRKPRRKEKMASEADAKLMEYFRDSYTVKPAITLTRSFGKEDPKCVKQMALFLELLGAKLDIPSDKNLEEDSSFDNEDRQMLKALRQLQFGAEPSRPLSPRPQLGAIPSGPPSATSPDRRSFSFVNIDCAPQTSSSDINITLPFENATPPSPEQPPITIKQETSEIVPLLRQPFYGSLKYICPPNHATMVGLRSILIKRRNLVETVVKNSHRDPLQNEPDSAKSEEFQNACQLWEDRLLFLFALPNLLSKVDPPDTSDKQTHKPKLRVAEFSRIVDVEARHVASTDAVECDRPTAPVSAAGNRKTKNVRCAPVGIPCSPTTSAPSTAKKSLPGRKRPRDASEAGTSKTAPPVEKTVAPTRRSKRIKTARASSEHDAHLSGE